MTGKIENTPGMINQETGLINENTGMIEDSTGMIEENTGLITETNDIEHATSGRRKRSRERGKDSKPRNFPLHTLKNLPQFRNKSHQEFRRHILEKKGVDIGGNVNTVHVVVLLILALVAITSPLWIEKLVDWYEKRKERR